jgi:hypothetical protein
MGSRCLHDVDNKWVQRKNVQNKGDSILFNQDLPDLFDRIIPVPATM